MPETVQSATLSAKLPQQDGGLLALAGSGLLAACGSGGGDSAPASSVNPPPPLPTPAAISEQEAARFLLQASLAATSAEISKVQTMGYAGWLDEQLAMPRSASHWDQMWAKGIQNDPDNANNFQGVDSSLWRKLMTAPDSLRQRVVLALSEIFVVSMTGLAVPWRGFCMAAYVDLLDQHAFTSYRALLEAVTLSTGMGNYLSMRGSQKEDPKSGREPDENYAREVLQLFSIGLYQLNADGDVQLDGKGQAIETYGQDSIRGLAKVFTGWDYTGFNRAEPSFQRQPMSLVASRHSGAEKSFLGLTIAAGTAGELAMKMALDQIAAHPNVGPFIGRQLIQRLVCSNPSSAYIGRVAAVWGDNGQGQRGDLKAVLKAILLDVEARQAPSGNSGGKLREPILRLVQWARTFNATSPSELWNVGDTSDPSRRLGQSPLRAPSVFNFFRPAYVPPNTALATAGLFAPELQISNESSVVAYLNFMQNTIQNGVGEVKANYADYLSLANDAPALLSRFNLLLAAGQVSNSNLNNISTAVGSIAANNDSGRLNRIYAAILLVMAAPEYLVQRGS